MKRPGPDLFSRTFPIALILTLGLACLCLPSCKGPNGKTSLPGLDDLEAFERERVIRAAGAYLEEEPVTVTAHRSERSLGGPHDFYSEGDYWWPDPEAPGGPYIRRDGQTNPANFTAHRRAMRDPSQWVPALVAAYKLTGDPRYAEHALRHLRAWFSDPKTKMNPHLLYGQAIKGRVSGRGIGIIDTIHLIEVAKAIQLLIEWGYLSAENAPDTDDAKGNGVPGRAETAETLLNWFEAYTLWLITHPYGIDEREHGNNHSAWWVAQVAAFADLSGNEAQKQFCRDFYKSRILPEQLDSLGRFSDELRRTKPYSYSMFNLEAFGLICHLLSTDREDLWDYSTENGTSTKRALEFMHPYWKDKSSWPYPPDVAHFDDLPIRGSALFLAGMRYQDPDYIETWKSLPADSEVQEVIRTFVIRQPLLWVD